MLLNRRTPTYTCADRTSSPSRTQEEADYDQALVEIVRLRNLVEKLSNQLSEAQQDIVTRPEQNTWSPPPNQSEPTFEQTFETEPTFKPYDHAFLGDVSDSDDGYGDYKFPSYPSFTPLCYPSTPPASEESLLLLSMSEV